ncbi:GNAT family N-acetyltransferase [Enterococcus villorum]|uniref:N-acetyltransferase n=2 Tax=Enterococcus villorum TaxID=112904 RepID=A0A511J3Z0_9ENTE|nr:GNAT family N-acetyltransferase [Enterococcus villorum]EOH93495.1 hypothetical protein UAO_00224 [Enterococcus villorum ATCC 700913]EOW75446.1 hypothetical protein I591_02535 [Enterococcus villorum ATCC 700913]GEL92720.1 N-acetyltransferase [Enterococcus villorum]
MEGYELIKLREHPEWIEQAAQWFTSKWHLPLSFYQESMAESLRLKNVVPQWYIFITAEQKIVAGAGVINNDFHDRSDLTPNLCALFVEKEYRNQGIAKEILATIRKDMEKLGVQQLYLATDYSGFYEKYDWQFLTMAQDNEGIPVYLYQIKTKE